MSTTTKTTIEEVENLEQAIESLKTFTSLILNTFAKHTLEPRDKIIGNTIARGITCLENIFLIWKAGSVQDTWILHRALLDRLFNLHYLIKNDLFSHYEEYCFVKTFETHQKFLDDKMMNSKATPEFIQKQESRKSRYAQLKAKNLKWTRPSAESIAKDMKLDILYQYGYQYASTHVHPYSDDGEDDYKRLTEIQANTVYPISTVVKNSFLVYYPLIQEALLGSSFTWRKGIFVFLDQIMMHLNDYNNLEYKKTLSNIAQMWPSMDLAKPKKTKLLKQDII